MITTLLFDFGDVFINLEKAAPQKALSKFGNPELLQKIIPISEKFEVGLIDTAEFVSSINTLFPKASEKQILFAWNSMLSDFPGYRLEFIKQLASKKEYSLILLSNTNEEHIRWIQNNISFYEEFKACFDAFYLSHEIQLRKPDRGIYKYVLDQHQLSPSEILFIDDTAINTQAAAELGIHTWNIDPAKEDVIDLFSSKSQLL